MAKPMFSNMAFVHHHEFKIVNFGHSSLFIVPFWHTKLNQNLIILMKYSDMTLTCYKFEFGILQDFTDLGANNG